MAEIRQYHKSNDTTYVYSSESYWDAEKGQSRSHRKLIGKVDPVTGEVIPTGKRGRKKKENKESEPINDSERKELLKKLEDANKQVKEQALLITRLQEKVNKLTNANTKLANAVDKALSSVQRSAEYLKEAK